MKSTDSQQVESKKTTDVSQQVESDATPHTPGSSVSFEISSTVTRDENHVAMRILKTLRIKDRLWVRSKILLQLDKLKEIHRSCMAHNKYDRGLDTLSYRRYFSIDTWESRNRF